MEYSSNHCCNFTFHVAIFSVCFVLSVDCEVALLYYYYLLLFFYSQKELGFTKSLMLTSWKGKLLPRISGLDKFYICVH